MLYYFYLLKLSENEIKNAGTYFVVLKIKKYSTLVLKTFLIIQFYV